jgi:hypothetical protein
VKATSVTAKTATITWQTSVPTSSEVDYGVDTNYGLTANNPSLVTDHSMALDTKLLLANTTFHYRVLGLDASNNTYTTGDLTFKTTASTATVKKKSSNTTVIAATVTTLALIGAGAGAYVWNSRRKLGVEGQIYDPSAAITSQSSSPPSSSSGAVVTPDKPEPVQPPVDKTPPKA